MSQSKSQAGIDFELEITQGKSWFPESAPLCSASRRTPGVSHVVLGIRPSAAHHDEGEDVTL